MNNKIVRKAWYFGSWSAELKNGQVKEVSLMGNKIALYRGHSGKAAAISNRCPHRFAPLHLGKVKGDRLECGYHGLHFRSNGKCSFSPHSSEIPSGISVPSYFTEEQHGIVWIWADNSTAPDPALIPDLSEIEKSPETARVVLPEMAVNAGYELLVDNLFDPSHADFVHQGTLGDGQISGIEATLDTRDRLIEANWAYPGEVVIPVLRTFMPGVEHFDSWVNARWYAPSIVRFSGGITPAGRPRDEGVWQAAYHIMTPDGDSHCLYNVAVVRNHDLADTQLSEFLAQVTGHAFNNEDKPMIEAQQLMLEGRDVFDLNPIFLPSDGPSYQVRRALNALIEAE